MNSLNFSTTFLLQICFSFCMINYKIEILRINSSSDQKHSCVHMAVHKPHFEQQPQLWCSSDHSDGDLHWADIQLLLCTHAGPPSLSGNLKCWFLSFCNYLMFSFCRSFVYYVNHFVIFLRAHRLVVQDINYLKWCNNVHAS